VAAKSTSSSFVGSWTSTEVALATIEETKVASYLIISAAFNDDDPKLKITLPRQLNYFVDEVKDGVVKDACLKSAKDWLDTIGQCLHQPCSCSHVVQVQHVS
jgi:hypothetical protein